VRFVSEIESSRKSAIEISNGCRRIDRRVPAHSPRVRLASAPRRAAPRRAVPSSGPADHLLNEWSFKKPGTEHLLNERSFNKCLPRSDGDDRTPISTIIRVIDLLNERSFNKSNTTEREACQPRFLTRSGAAAGTRRCLRDP
jgi:hypothetical protein